MPLQSISWSSDESLWRRWRRHAELTPEREAIGFVRAGEMTERWSWAQLITRAEQYAAWLREHGVRAGETCAIISRHHKEFYPLYLGVNALGALPAVLAYPNPRLHPDKFREGLLGMARQSGLNWILTEKALEPTLSQLRSAEDCPSIDMLFPYDAELSFGAQHVPTPLSDAGAPALLQHSSGTTGLQKAVVLSHRAILEHVTRYGASIELTATDRIVSWLPLYHDMGLIAAFHMPLAAGIPVIHIDPFEWVVAPVLLIETLSAELGTLSWLPNFAYSLMGERLHSDDLQGLSLSHVRMLVNCSEPLRSESHAALLRKLAPIGLRASALAGSYAMAETTFAATQTAPGSRAAEICVARDALAAEGHARPARAGEAERVCVSSGRTIDGCELIAVDAAGAPLPDDRVGELLVQSVSLFDGYRNRPDKTAESFQGPWFKTGDLGFRRAGEWFVVGRKKDLIIVAGKNLYPEDIEAVVASVPGVLPGRAVAFGEEGSEGTERVCVVLETELSAEHHDGLRQRVTLAAQSIDVSLQMVYVVPPRWLIKSSSGKLSRAINRERVLRAPSKDEP